MDTGNLIKIRSNMISLKEEKTADVLQTPQIGRFKHENENVNYFSISFKQENLKSNPEELSRLNSLTSLSSPSPYPNDFSLIDPSEHQQQSSSSSPSSSSSSSSSMASSSFQTNSPHTPNSTPTLLVSSTSLTDSSKSAPKKKFLERTISQNDSELQLQNKHELLVSDLNQNYLRQESQNNETKNNSLKRSVSTKSMDVLEEIPSKLLKTNNINTSNNNDHLLSLPNAHPIIDYQKRQISNVSTNSNNFLISSDKTSHVDNKKPTIDNILKNVDFTNSNHKLNNLTPLLPNLDNSHQQHSDKLKQKDDIVTSSIQESEKKPKSKRSIMMNSDLRKQQIRNSNREAARRCRERRSNYIKTLENKITILESKQKQLMTENSGLHKQVHDLKQILDHSNLGYSNHNFNQLNNNFGAIFPNNGQIKSVPLVLTVEIPNSGALNGAHVVGNQTNNIRQITNVLNSTNALMNNQDLFKHVVDSFHYRSPHHHTTHLHDSQSQQQSTKINK